MEQLRLFIAIDLDEVLRAELLRIQTQLQYEYTRTQVAQDCVRWVSPQNIHLTLKFLGNTQPSQIDALKQVLERVAQTTAPFVVNARGVGCFPNQRRPNTVWVGLAGAVDSAVTLARRIEDECAALGVPRDERGFTPHLTLGRVKQDATNHERADLGEMLRNMPLRSFGSIQASAMHVIASDLKPYGPVYSTLATLAFRG